MIGRCMYVHRLDRVIAAEGSVRNVIDKARRARLSAIWVKVAEGQSRFVNVIGAMKQSMSDLVDLCQANGVRVWGWQVPHCSTVEKAQAEATVFGDVAREFGLDGLIMDAEGTAAYFQGDVLEARTYAQEIRRIADDLGQPLGLSSNDIPANIEGW